MDHTPVEETVRGIWSDVLGVEHLGPDDDFFELGGTSLHAARVLTRTRAKLGVKLSPDSLFEHSTLTGFVAQVEGADAPETLS